ncbi:cysteine desulfurase [Synergistales bacterium]|nr:cysteine desulfurase [Synergistales bacterium]
MSVYLNNAATSWPKPEPVTGAVLDFLTNGGANLARGSSGKRDVGAMSLVLDCRIKVALLLGGYGKDPNLVTFCPNVTGALNTVLKGFFDHKMKSGRKVRFITTSMEHNALARPLCALESRGAELVVLPCSTTGALDASALDAALSANAAGNKMRGFDDMVVLSHASNVCGTVQPLEDIAAVTRRRRAPLVVDSAQTAGVIPIDAASLGLAALCFTGHKALMGPQGTGGVLWSPDFALEVSPLTEGGTGSFSHLLTQPPVLPDKFESGTPNLPGIAGLSAALSWLAATGIDNIASRERELGEFFLARLRRARGVTLYGLPDMSENRLSVFAFNVSARDNGILAGRLADAGFDTRPGLHCAPLAHRTLGSFPEGSLRVSIGYFNTKDEIEAFWDCLEGI